MGEAIGGVLGYAVGIALRPVPIAAAILMLFSARARTNSLSFMVAWALGIATVATVVVLVPGVEAEEGAPSDTTGWVKLGLGSMLAVAAVTQWRGRPERGDAVETPGWMARIDSMGEVPAFGLGFLLSALNPKNLLLAAAAGATIGSVGLTGGETVVAVAIFTIIAAISVVAPVIGYLFAGDRLDTRLDAMKDMLIRNNTAVMAVLFVVLGLSLIGDGIEILSA